ncbi:Pol polyprotein [Elysia marginata]|uniref:Pol polyprotein n=1 Tax=Elysia marginata TaxID=1093978 RepID=A0AAV4HSP4_9GAST|nr:Pol polyprotein [Elysia marginata]
MSKHVPSFSIPTPDTPWQKFAIDVTGPFIITLSASKFLVVLMDYNTKYPEILMTPTITSQKITDWLNLARYGAPEELVSDKGTNFTSEHFTDFLRSYNVLHSRTAVYHLQENGFVERFNCYLKYGIQEFYSSGQPWASGIQTLLRNYRSTPLTPDGHSPGELIFGRKIRLPYQIPRPTARPRSAPPQHASSAESDNNLRCRRSCKVGNKVLARLPHVLTVPGLNL